MRRGINSLRLLFTLTGIISTCSSAAAEPSIVYTQIPAFGTSDNLKGQADGVAFSNYSVAVYIYVSGWWTKPTFADPLTALESEGSWECDVTTGSGDLRATRFAAFLVPDSYTPPIASGSVGLPGDIYSNAVDYVVENRPAGREFGFSGYHWWAKETFGGLAGPGPNYFSGSTNNVWVDTDGRLHLRVMEQDGNWQCAEIVSLQSFGYGNYRIFLDTPVVGIDQNAVLGLFTWSDAPEYAHREIDVEISTWGDATDTNNSQFVVQPWNDPGHLVRYLIPPNQSNTTHGFNWSSNSVEFISYLNHYEIPPSSNSTNAIWTFSGTDVPQAGGENFRMNLWLNSGAAPSDGEAMEIIISRFVFIPENIPSPRIMEISGLPGGGVEVVAETEPQLAVEVKASTNLYDWVSLETMVAASNVLTFTDYSAITNPTGFYRLVVPPQ